MHNSTNLFNCRTTRWNSSSTFSGYVRRKTLSNDLISLDCILRVVRLLNTSSSSTNQNVTHRIRVQYFDRRKAQNLLGKRDVTCKILSFKPFEPTHNDEINRSTSSKTVPNTSPQETRTWLKTQTFILIFEHSLYSGDPLVIIVLTILSIICAFILLLPTIPDSESTLQTRIPSYLHMTTNGKVIAGFILGNFLRLNRFSHGVCCFALGLLTVVFIRRW